MENDIAASVPQQRPQWGERAAVVVPKLEHQQKIAAMIAPGSGIVAFAREDDHFIVYYEGNLNGASNLGTLEDRTMNAYGRMSKRYPTIAMCALKSDFFEVIGHITPDEFVVDRENKSLAAWVAHDPALLESPVRYQRGPRR